MKDCQMVVFSNKAYNAIIRETFEWDPVETGGILLGHVLGNGCWIVMEVVPPGYTESGDGNRVSHEWGYFEYNKRFVDYMVNQVASQYNIPLDLLGLWHRHPSSMDVFSTTDDGTNRKFAMLNVHGAISGLVNVDPQLRLTMYHIDHLDQGPSRPVYEKVPVEIGSDIIPEEYFELRYYQGTPETEHPFPLINRPKPHAGIPQQQEEVSLSVTLVDPSSSPSERKPSIPQQIIDSSGWMVKAKRFYERNKLLSIGLIAAFVLLCIIGWFATFSRLMSKDTRQKTKPDTEQPDKTTAPEKTESDTVPTFNWFWLLSTDHADNSQTTAH